MLQARKRKFAQFANTLTPGLMNVILPPTSRQRLSAPVASRTRAATRANRPHGRTLTMTRRIRRRRFTRRRRGGRRINIRRMAAKLRSIHVERKSLDGVDASAEIRLTTTSLTPDLTFSAIATGTIQGARIGRQISPRLLQLRFNVKQNETPTEQKIRIIVFRTVFPGVAGQLIDSILHTPADIHSFRALDDVRNFKVLRDMTFMLYDTELTERIITMSIPLRGIVQYGASTGGSDTRGGFGYFILTDEAVNPALSTLTFRMRYTDA